MSMQNKKKRKWFLAGLFLLPLVSLAQSLTLDSAFEMAKRNYPLIRQKELIQKTAQQSVNMSMLWIFAVL